MKNKREKMHPAVMDLQSDLLKGHLSRREFLRLATLLGASIAAANMLAGCGSSQTGSAPTDSAAAVQRGGTLKIGSRVLPVDHPARLATLESGNQLRQVGEYLTATNQENITQPWLLDQWEVDEAVKTWTLRLRQGINFNNGQPLTVDDVIFSFNQWLDPDVGSSMVSLLYYLDKTGIERINDYTLRLHLNEPQIGVPEHLFHYPAIILPRTFEGNFIDQPIGTGPFTLESFVEGDRAVFKRRADYWRTGAENEALPYLDELTYFDLEPDERIEAMQAGVIDTLILPAAEEWDALKTAPGINVYGVSTARGQVVRMNVTKPPWNDVRVRNALKLCQDRQKILDLAHLNQGDLAIDAHVAPIHPAYCEKPIPKYQPEQAKALLAEAGYLDGLTVQLTAKNDTEETQIANMLKELAAPGGFNIELNMVAPAKYWEQWTELDLGITSWGHRPLDTMALALAYTANENGEPVPWNETHWVDQAFIKLLRQAEQTLDVEQRRQMMCELEDIMQERGPVGLSYWAKNWNIIRSEFKNVRANPEGYDLFADVWKDNQTI
ncbi:MAG: hypothetical protein KDI02_18845 [Anaerolineae bacterium]|nr:hypothetical protein [Anaerolineae bacterium]